MKYTIIIELLKGVSTMVKPPIYPLELEKGVQSTQIGEEMGMTYFQKLVLLSKEYLEGYIQLNFTGYTETLVEYANLEENQLNKAWKLAKELNAWAEYFSSICHVIQKIYLDAETDKKSTQAQASYEADPSKVATGDRLSNKDIRVVNSRKKRNTLKALYEELEAKTKFLERAHYHCKATYEMSIKQKPLNSQPYVVNN